MGTTCIACELVPLERELISYREQVKGDGRKLNFQCRRGKPSARIAYPIRNFCQEDSSLDVNTDILERIRKITKLDRKKKLKPLELEITPRPENELPQAYYIPSSECVYIGEWVYDQVLQDEVPKGIGRLYSETKLSEGEFETIGTCEESSPNSSPIKAIISLNGLGRSLSHELSEVGRFKDGVLHGRGQIVISKESYSYDGQWQHGKKQGKGIERTASTTYDGEFVQDMKSGRGVLIFMLGPQFQKERLAEQHYVAKGIQQESNQTVELIRRQLNLKRARSKIIKAALEPYKWKMFPDDSQKNSVQMKKTKKNGVSPRTNEAKERKENEEIQSAEIQEIQEPQSLFDGIHFILSHHFQQRFQEKYVGDFENDQMHGIGTYTWFNGKVHHGEWRSGQICGFGEFYWPDGAIYRGHYQNDSKHGQGELIWHETKRFRGAWRDGIRKGYGELIQILQDQHQSSLWITGGLWLHDEVLKTYFTKKISLPGYQAPLRVFSPQIASDREEGVHQKK